MIGLHIQYLEATEPDLERLRADAVAEGPFGVFRLQSFEFGLGLFLFGEGRPRREEHRCEISTIRTPWIRGRGGSSPRTGEGARETIRSARTFSPP
jgi:hypothetical protein